MGAQVEAKERVEAKVVSVELGPYAAWIGPGVFALAILAYSVAAAFEARVVSSKLVAPALSAAVAAADLSTGEFVAHVHWRASVLLLIVAGLAVVVVSTTMIWAYLRRAPLQAAFMALLVTLTAIIHNTIGGGADLSTSFLAKLLSLIDPKSAALGTLNITQQIKSAAEFVAVLIGIAAASVLILPRQVDSLELARRAGQLRVLLFTTAALFATAILSNAAAYSWLVAAVPWDSGVDAGTPRSIVVAGTYLAGAFYTLTLTSVFVPCAGAVVLLGRRLALRSEGDPGAWLESNGLTFTWKGQFANIGALLTPLASTVLAQLLSSMN